MTAQVQVAAPISPTDVYDHLTQAREILQWVQALGSSIELASEHGRTGTVKSLAGLVNYLGTDWAAHFDSQAAHILETHEKG